jgi:hypothetical protein
MLLGARDAAAEVVESIAFGFRFSWIDVRIFTCDY